MKDVEFMSGKEKERVLKAWVRFIKNGFRWEDFPDRLYKHLTLHCSFIAHYNRQGFYSTYFSRPEDTIRFLRQFDKGLGCVSVEYGYSTWLRQPDYQDINMAMCEAIEPYKEKLYQRLSGIEKEQDIRHARLLCEKHGITLNL